jgi:hypothetical protein
MLIMDVFSVTKVHVKFVNQVLGFIYSHLLLNARQHVLQLITNKKLLILIVSFVEIPFLIAKPVLNLLVLNVSLDSIFNQAQLYVLILAQSNL